MKDKYKLGHCVGTGGYSIVRVAKSKETGEAVAIKIIKKKELSRRQLKST